MQKTKKKRKGFTLTELAIVIAVIAILIAVLVPTFVSLINKANESADEQAVKSMNTALSADEALNGTPETVEDAMQVLTDAGLNVKNYQALDSNNTIYYDYSYNRCLLWSAEDDAVIYPSDLAETYEGVSGRAASWYTLSEAYTTKSVSSSSDLTSAVSAATSAGTTVILQLKNDLTDSSALSSSLGNGSYTFTVGDDSYTNQTAISGAYVTIDLNGYELDYKARTFVLDGGTLYIKNGTLNTGSTYTSNNYLYAATSNSSITFEDVEVTSAGTVLYPQGDSAQINIINSNINTSGAYCISTNAGKDENYNVAVHIQDSTLICSGGTSVMFNVPGIYTVTDSTIVTAKGYPAFIARGGDITIDNCMIATSLHTYTNHSSIWNRFMDDCTYTTTTHSNDGYYTKWQSGNGTPYAALCIGNDADSTSYQYYTNCTVTNTEFHTGLGFMCVYVEGNSTEAYGATFTYSDCSFYYHSVEDSNHPSIMDDIDNGTEFSTVSPTEYSSSLYNSGNTNPLDYAIIYTNDSESYVTINGTGYKAAAD